MFAEGTRMVAKLVAILCLVACGDSPTAPEPIDITHTPGLQGFPARLDSLRVQLRIPGMSAAIVQDGQPLPRLQAVHPYLQLMFPGRRGGQHEKAVVVSDDLSFRPGGGEPCAPHGLGIPLPYDVRPAVQDVRENFVPFLYLP